MSYIDKKKMSAAAAATLGLPAGLAVGQWGGGYLGRLAAPDLWAALNHLPLLHPGSESVATATVVAASALAPMALMPAVRALQKTEALPRWASAPVGLAIAASGVIQFAGALMSGTSMSTLGLGPLFLTAVGCLTGLFAGMPPGKKKSGTKRARRDPDGPWQANWWPMAEARKILSAPDGLILGEACVPVDQPEKIGIAPLLRWRPKGSLLTVAGSGGGKGVSAVVPNCLAWSGPLVVHDPAGETLAVVRGHRQRMGRKVRVISLDDDTDGVNVLESLDPAAKTFPKDVRAVVSWLDKGGDGGKEDDSSFAGLAKSLCVALIMFVLTSPTIPDPERHLGKVRELAASPNLRELLGTMTAMREVGRGTMADNSGFCLGTMKSDKTFAGVTMHFNELTACVNGAEEVLCGAVASGKRFSFSDILQGDTGVFICLPADTLKSEPQIARILLGGLAMLFMRRKERATYDTMFIVDEMPLLGKMDILMTMLTFGRKFGLLLWAIAQDLGQIEEAYGRTGLRSWTATPAITQVLAVNDLETAEMLSKRCGDFTAEQESESTSKGRTRNPTSGSTSDTTSESKQGTRTALVPPDEIMSLMVDDDGNPEEQLLFVRGRRPLRCGLAKYYRRKEMAGLFDDNPFYRPSKPAVQPAARRAAWQTIAAGAWGAAMLALAGVAAVAPLPLMAGDEAVIVGDQPAQLFTLAGRPLDTAPLGWRVRLTAFPRADGYVDVTFYDPHGKVWDVLINKDVLERL